MAAPGDIYQFSKTKRCSETTINFIKRGGAKRHLSIFENGAGPRAHAVCLRSDGSAAAFGENDRVGENDRPGAKPGRCDIPPLAAGQTYVQVAAGGARAVLLRNDGVAMACGSGGGRGLCRCDLPTAPVGQMCVLVAAGCGRAVLLRNDGVAVACGTSASRRVPRCFAEERRDGGRLWHEFRWSTRLAAIGRRAEVRGSRGRSRSYRSGSRRWVGGCMWLQWSRAMQPPSAARR